MSSETGDGAGDAAARKGRTWGDLPEGLTWDDISEDLTWDDLANTDVPLGREDAPRESDLTDSLDTKEREQILAFREKLFSTVNKLVVIALISGIVLMIVYMCVKRGDLDYRVLVAWYAGVAAQTIGVLAVIAKNLFPGGSAH